MSLLNFESKPRYRSGKNFKWIALISIVAAILKVSGTLAANVNINSGRNVEFGQGQVAATACSGSNSLTLQPMNSFDNANNNFLFSGITVSGVPSSCSGAQFTITVYASTGNTALSIYNTNSKEVVINNYSGTYSVASGYSGLAVTSGTSGATTSFTVTFNTPVALSSTVAKFAIESKSAPARDYGSLYYNSSAASTIPTGPILGTGAYTLEFWLNLDANPTGNSLLVSGNYGLGTYLESGRNSLHIDIWIPGTGDHAFTFPAISLNAWHHFALVRNSSGLTQLFVDGQPSTSGTYTDSNNYAQAISTLFGGGAGGTATGYLSNLRITNTSVYSPSASSITVPTSPLTAISGTQLLLNTTTTSPLVDSSSSARTLTAGGAVSRSNSPFS